MLTVLNSLANILIEMLPLVCVFHVWSILLYISFKGKKRLSKANFMPRKFCALFVGFGFLANVLLWLRNVLVMRGVNKSYKKITSTAAPVSHRYSVATKKYHSVLHSKESDSTLCYTARSLTPLCVIQQGVWLQYVLVSAESDYAQFCPAQNLTPRSVGQRRFRHRDLYSITQQGVFISQISPHKKNICEISYPVYRWVRFESKFFFNVVTLPLLKNIFKKCANISFLSFSFNSLI